MMTKKEQRKKIVTQSKYIFDRLMLMLMPWLCPSAAAVSVPGPILF